jgi:hypothetical protein
MNYKSGLFDVNGNEVKVGDKVVVLNRLDKYEGVAFDVTFEDGAFCMRMPNTTIFRQAVTFRDGISQALERSQELKFEIIK